MVEGGGTLVMGGGDAFTGTVTLGGGVLELTSAVGGALTACGRRHAAH